MFEFRIHTKQHCGNRAEDLHSFFADPDLDDFLNADLDPEPALQNL